MDKNKLKRKGLEGNIAWLKRDEVHIKKFLNKN